MNDDGGPSYWWRDAYVRQLQKGLVKLDVSESVAQEIYSRLSDVDAEIIDRLNLYLATAQKDKGMSADDLFARFGASEDKLKKLTEARVAILIGVPLLFAGIAATVWFTFDAVLWLKILWTAATAASLPAVVAWYQRPHPRAFMGTKEIADLPSSREIAGRQR